MKQNKRQSGFNMFLSVFLVIAYVVCMYFVNGMIQSMEAGTLQTLLNVILYVAFGALLFYATRVGEGKQVKRFSLSVLLLMVVPGLYIALSFFASGLPLSSEITNSTALSILGLIMLGYGIPYTFVSGFEMLPEPKEIEPTKTIVVDQEMEEGDALEEEEDSLEEEDAAEMQNGNEQEDEETQSESQAEENEEGSEEESEEEKQTQSDSKKA